MEKKYRHSFFNKIVLVFFIIIVVTLIAFYRSFISFSDTMKKNIERNIIYRATENSLNIRDSIKNLTNQIDGIVQRTEIRSMDWDKQEPVLIMECERCGIESVQIAELDGTARSTMGYQENIQEKDYFKEALNDLISVSDPVVREFDGKTVILCSAPIRDKHERIIGIFVAHMDLTFLFNIIENMRLGTTGYGFIVSREGKLLAHSMMNIDKSGFETMKKLQNRDFITFIETIVRRKVGHDYFLMNGTQRFVAYTPVMGTDWSLVLSLERNEMFHEVNEISNQFKVTFVILIIFTVFFGIYCFRYYIQEKKLYLLRQDSEKNSRLLLETKEIDKIRTEFFANISHELRTPLNVILSSLQLMNLYLKTKPHLEKETAQKHLWIIKRNSLRLNRLINNLIDTTRINSNFYELHTSNCNIVEIVREIAATVEDYVKRKGITLSFYTDVKEKIITCDVDKVERILLNLLSNAIKFTDEGGRISIFLNDDETTITLTVEDTGIGIPQEKIEQIFTRFQQVDKTFARNFEGSGIGLSLVKSMVEMHSGSINVISSPGNGSKFIVKLPVCQTGHAHTEEDYQYDRNQFNQRIQVELSDFCPQPGADVQK